MKKTIRYLLILAFLNTLGCALENQDEPIPSPEKLTIVFASDIHYLSPSLTDYGEFFMDLIKKSDGKVTHYTPEIVQAFVRQVLQINPSALVLSGDLTLNGDQQSHEELTAMLKEITDADIPVYVIPGNHDVEGNAYRFDDEGVHPFAAVSSNDFASLYADLGYQNAQSTDNATLSYIAPISEKLWLLMLDVNAYRTLGNIPESTLAWIEEELISVQENGITVLGVSHQNAFVHNRMFQFSYQMGRSDKLIELYDTYNVELNLSGHLHLQSIIENEQLTEIATSSLAVTPHQFALLNINTDATIDYSTVPVDVSGWAQANNSTNEDLLNFASYSEQFFDDTSQLKMVDLFSSADIPSADQTAMIDFGVEFNRRYFTGTLDNTLLEDRAFQLWNQYLPDSFYIRYFKSLEPNAFQSQNTWSSQ